MLTEVNSPLYHTSVTCWRLCVDECFILVSTERLLAWISSSSYIHCNNNNIKQFCNGVIKKMFLYVCLWVWECTVITNIIKSYGMGTVIMPLEKQNSKIERKKTTSLTFLTIHIEGFTQCWDAWCYFLLISKQHKRGKRKKKSNVKKKVGLSKKKNKKEKRTVSRTCSKKFSGISVFFPVGYCAVSLDLHYRR